MQHYIADQDFHGDIVLLEPQQHDADFFALNPMAFWRRSEAMQLGFESVRSTIEGNFAVLDDVFARHGLEMNRESARGKAVALREEQGWESPAKRSVSPERAPLRVVKA